MNAPPPTPEQTLEDDDEEEDEEEEEEKGYSREKERERERERERGGGTRALPWEGNPVRRHKSEEENFVGRNIYVDFKKAKSVETNKKASQFTKHRATFFFHLSRTTTSSKSAKVSTTRTRAHTRGVAPKREARAI